MSHYEQRLEQDLKIIREHMRKLSGYVTEALENALSSLFSGNRKLAYATILNDERINERMRELDTLCHRFIARHLPSAGHLRYMSAAIRTSLQLERLGDYAVTIAREGVQLSAPPEGLPARQLDNMADHANRMLALAIDAFDHGNEEKARTAISLSASVEDTFDHIYAGLMADSQAFRIKDLLALFVVFNMIKRISDQAQNICEDTLFAVTGETRRTRVYNVLFVDEDNAFLSQMAETIARRTYPSSAQFSSAGRVAAERVDPALMAFLDEFGVDLSGTRPQRLDPSPESLSKYFVIVSLDGLMERYTSHVPFHTTVLEWDVGARPQGLEGEALRRHMEELYREIAAYVRGLVETLRGEESAS